MGALASIRDLGSREDCVQNFAFPRHAAVPLERAGALHQSEERKPDGNGVRAHSGAIFQYAGSVVGLAVAAIFLATAVGLRRYREPI